MNNFVATATGSRDNRAVYNEVSSPTMSNVTATATGGANSYGVYNVQSSPTMTNVTATATSGGNNYGVYDDSSSPTIRNSTIVGSITLFLSGTLRIYNSTITAIPTAGLGSLCYGTYIAGGSTTPVTCT